MYYDGKTVLDAVGDTYGSITIERSGGGGFGYDPVFYSDDIGKTFGEASEQEKNKVSHRARALAAIVKKLTEI